MLIGHDNLTQNFKKIIDGNKFSHAYLFFGEPEVGKFSFALALGNYLETGSFDEPSGPLTETFIIRPDEKGTIGIDSARELKRFLLQTPVRSSRRMVIIDNAEWLTAQAQQAILKIVEEPPQTALIILIVSNSDSLLPTLQSRMQKIYFPRVATALIVSMLVKKVRVAKTESTRIAQISFGRPGRAIKLAGNRKQESGIRNKKELVGGMVEDPEFLREQLSEIIAKLARDPVKNYKTLRSIIGRLTKISQFNTNKRLQLESALWNI